MPLLGSLMNSIVMPTYSSISGIICQKGSWSMFMNEITIQSFEDFHKRIQAYDRNKDIYRGVRKRDYELKPKIGRVRFPPRKNRKEEEKLMLQLFEERAMPYFDLTLKDEWERIAVAQHFGLPTRLLDWTRNPLVAAFFAVEQEYKGDSAIYVLKGYNIISTEETMHMSPLEPGKVGKYAPPHITERIVAQASIFTIHPEPEIAFLSDSVDKLIIPHSLRRELKKILDTYGINRAALFPGLDGLASHITWLRTKSH